MANTVTYIIGVSGCGKSTIGSLLGKVLNLPFFDGDDFHPPENIAKMSNNRPLDDADRMGWLWAIQQFAVSKVQEGSLVIACSALKESYRQILQSRLNDSVNWVFLNGDYQTILRRVRKREHFMPSTLLASQFEVLEVPQYGLHINILDNPNQIINQIRKQFTL